MFWVRKINVSLRRFLYAHKTYNMFDREKAENNMFLLFGVGGGGVTNFHTCLLYIYVYLPIFRTIDNSK